MASLLDLLTNASTTGAWQKWRGGRGSIGAAGTFNGATITIEARFGSVTAPVGPAAVFTAPGWVGFEFPEGVELRAAVSGGTPTGLNCIALYGRIS